MKLNEATSNGIYSLKTGWLKKPVKDDIPEVDLEPELTEWVTEANQVETADDINKFIDDIYVLRQESILKDGEYGKGNLIFKELRNQGIIQSLKDKLVELENKEMSLTEDKKGAKLYICSNCGYEAVLTDDEYDGSCPHCHEHDGEFLPAEEDDNFGLDVY